MQYEILFLLIISRRAPWINKIEDSAFPIFWRLKQLVVEAEKQLLLSRNYDQILNNDIIEKTQVFLLQFVCTNTFIFIGLISINPQTINLFLLFSTTKLLHIFRCGEIVTSQ